MSLPVPSARKEFAVGAGQLGCAVLIGLILAGGVLALGFMISWVFGKA
jgi:hypothetical protein